MKVAHKMPPFIEIVENIAGKAKHGGLPAFTSFSTMILKYLDPYFLFFLNRVISVISVVQKETTLTIPDSTDKPVVRSVKANASKRLKTVLTKHTVCC